MITHLDLAIRIVTGASLGGIIGYERDRHGRPVGLRTHLLVAMASATFMVVSAHFVEFQHYGPGVPVEVDASRIAASVVSGIGFLAGGAILRTGNSVQGLTTAAGLWLVTAIGLCAGAAMYFESVLVTVLGVLALTIVRRFEDKDDRYIHRHIELTLSEDPEVVSSVAVALNHVGVIVTDRDYERRFDAKRRTTVIFDARIPSSIGLGPVVAVLATQPGVLRLRVRLPI